MKLRLFMRKAIADADGRCVGYDYISQVVDVVLDNESLLCRPEVVGGEWLPDCPGKPCEGCASEGVC